MKSQKNEFGIVHEVATSDRESDGCPELTQQSERALSTLLERVLTDAESLVLHFACVADSVDRIRHRQKLPVDQVELVLKTGLSTLSNSQLARLSLNPVALAQLYFEIDEKSPKHWLEVSKRARDV